jgi:hypothetical protein
METDQTIPDFLQEYAPEGGVDQLKFESDSEDGNVDTTGEEQGNGWGGEQVSGW